MKLKKLLVLLLLAVAALTLSACGDPGVQGEQGPKGDTGDTGAVGDKGLEGDQGEQGDKGQAGADGVQIEFSFTSEGLAWRYKGTTKWTVGVTYSEIFDLMPVDFTSRVAALEPDFVVSPALSEKQAGDVYAAYGKTFIYGESAFSTLADAFAAAKTAAEDPAYAGLKIFAEPGVYAEEVALEAKDVTLFGPNVDVCPIDDTENTTKKAAFLTGTIYVCADGFTLNGITFAGRNKDTDTFADVAGSGKSNITYAAGVKDQKILYCNSAEGTDAADEDYKILKKQYMIIFGGACENFEMAHSLIFPKGTGGDIRPFKNQLGVSKNFFIHDCYFDYNETSDQYDDVVRLDYIDGEFRFEKNTVAGWSNQTSLFLGNKQNTADVIIRGNYFGYTGLAEGGHGAGIWIRRAGEAFAAGKTILVEYNEFGSLCDVITIRTVAEYTVPAEGYLVTVQHNIFDCECAYLDLQGATSSVVAEELKPAVLLNGNYYKNSTNSDLLEGLTDANAKATIAEVEVLKANANKIRDAYVADYMAVNSLTDKTFEILDTNNGESSWMTAMLSDTAMNAKWGWLYEQLAVVSENYDLASPTPETAQGLRGAMLANLYGLFTGTQHKDTWLEVDSADWSIEANVLLVLDAAPAELK